jgi:hypothetical protein
MLADRRGGPHPIYPVQIYPVGVILAAVSGEFSVVDREGARRQADDWYGRRSACPPVAIKEG